MASSAIIVGAGIGGLAAAAVLARAGVRVTLIERSDAVGGKLAQHCLLGRPIDVGPTVLTMMPQLEAVFAAAGGRLDKLVTLEALTPLARHFFADGSELDLFCDLERSVAAVKDFAGEAEGLAYRSFAERCARQHGVADALFLRGPRPGLASIVRGAMSHSTHDLLALGGHRTMRGTLEEAFTDERLRSLFGRYATYVGASPFAAPATLNVIAHVERLGVWAVAGGLQQIAIALLGLARQNGASTRLATGVNEILVARGRVIGVRLASGESLHADAVIFNGDVAAIEQGLLGPAIAKAVPTTKRHSYSAVTIAMLARVRGQQLAYHNVFFSSDTTREFSELSRGHLPREPTIYIAAQDRIAQGPPALERLLLIVNAPAGLQALSDATEKRQWAKQTIERLDLKHGLTLTPEALHVTAPMDFAARYPATNGALYGPSSEGMAASFRRACERSRVPGLYLAGGSTHPGAGVPMAAQSGLLAAKAALADLASTSPSQAMATPGGTSMS